MNWIDVDHPEMELSGIDRILASEEPLIPSLGFLDSVMEKVREEAAAPPPIPFPWKRAIPAVLFTAGIFGWAAFELVRLGLPAAGSLADAGSVSLAMPHLSAVAVQPFEPAGWVALALGTSLFSWLLARRLAGQSGLL
ncbi:MAG: hypothetical protein ABSD43_16035 [Terracidiphilus sp.]|jgi:hypothetical protein